MDTQTASMLILGASVVALVLIEVLKKKIDSNHQ